jgi:threonyl-tRNA synthetase
VVGRKDVERGDDVVTVRDTRTGEQRQVGLDELVAQLSADAAKRGPEATPPQRATA